MAVHTDEPLLPQQQEQQNDNGPLRVPRRFTTTTWIITASVFVLFALDWGVALYSGHRISDLALLSIFGVALCLDRYEKAEPGSRFRLKAAVWLLTAGFALLFASDVVGAVVSPAIAVVACLVAFGAVAAGFYATFLIPKQPCGREEGLVAHRQKN